MFQIPVYISPLLGLDILCLQNFCGFLNYGPFLFKVLIFECWNWEGYVVSGPDCLFCVLGCFLSVSSVIYLHDLVLWQISHGMCFIQLQFFVFGVELSSSTEVP